MLQRSAAESASATVAERGAKNERTQDFASREQAA
jgi:hypothetical protein